MQNQVKIENKLLEIELPQTVGILFSDVKREYFATEEQFVTENGADQDARLIADYLESLGLTTFLYPGNAELPERLLADRPEVVMNFVDSVHGDESLSSSIPGVLELLGFPYTGADTLGLAMDTNKFLIKKILRQNGIPVPNNQLFNKYTDRIDPSLRFPLIAKLNSIHGAVEITREAICENEKQLRKRVKYLIDTYRQEVLVEEFIVGREITAILLEGMKKKVYLAEKVFTKEPDKYMFTTFEDQWLTPQGSCFDYAKFEDPTLKDYVKRAFDAVKMYDYGKFDIRMDPSGRYYFIDTNCNPAFGPKELDVALSVILDLYGVSFFEILKRLLLNTVRDAAGKERISFPAEMNS